MGVLTTQAVVLREWDFSETSQTVALFTRTHGLVRGLAKGAKREKSRFSGGFEPLTRGELLFIDSTKSDLATLTEWDLHEVYWGARRSYRAHLGGLYICDLLSRAVADHDPHPALFDHLARLLNDLDDTRAHHRVVLEFQWKLLHETGSAPNLDAPGGSRQAVGFDPARGGFVDDPGPDGPLDIWRVRRETLDLLRRLADNTPLTNDDDPERVRRAASLLAAFLMHALGRDLTTRAAYFDHEPIPNPAT